MTKSKKVDLFFDWEPKFRASILVLIDKGNGKVVVDRLASSKRTGLREYRLYDAYLDNKCIYDARDEFKSGDVIKI